MVSKELITELGVILDQEFNLKLEPQRLEQLANFLVSYFQILLKVNKQQ